MQAAVENYKGIEFVRISSLPEDQKTIFWNSFNTQKIIKILRNEELLNDCLKYEDYRDWYHQRFTPSLAYEHASAAPPEFKLAFK